MRRLTLIGTAGMCAAALAFPMANAGAVDEHSRSAVAKQCAADKKANKALFRATWGKHAMRNCIKSNFAGTSEPVVTPTTPPPNPAQTCDEQRDADPAGFTSTWGSNNPHGNSHGGGKNAYGQCVSSTAQSSHGGGPPA